VRSIPSLWKSFLIFLYITIPNIVYDNESQIYSFNFFYEPVKILEPKYSSFIKELMALVFILSYVENVSI